MALSYALGGIVALAVATPAPALSVADCARVTHVTHAGEDMHRDLGEGRVMWRSWWSNEGTYDDYVIADCSEGRALQFRVAESGISAAAPFDRTEAALKVVEVHEKGARVFATFERMAADLRHDARKIEILDLYKEPCACAALYAQMRGDEEAFQLAD